MSDVLFMDLISTKILSKISFVVFSSHQRWAKKKKRFNVKQIPTAVLVGGLGIDKDKPNSECNTIGSAYTL